MTSTIETEETEAREVGGWTRSMTCSFLCGAAAGAGLAVLLAPARGRDIRAQAAAKARQSLDQASQTLERGRVAVQRTRSHVKEQTRHVSKVINEGREAVAEIRARGERALEAIGEEVTGAVADAKAAFREVRTDGNGTASD